MKHSIFSRLSFLFVLALTAGTTVFAQNAQVTGRVTDQTGAIVPGAAVSATNQQTGLSRDAVTNAEGYFTILYLPPGAYKIVVKKDGFKSLERPDVVFNVDQRARLDFALEAGAVTDAVTITSEAPLLNRETPAVGTVVENKLVETLPLNGRSYTQLVTLIPGSVANPNSRAKDAVQLNGQRLSQTTYLIDGMDNNNPIGFEGAVTGSSQAVLPSIDAIQEFRVEGSNYSAEYGRSSGGVVNVAIKSGANKLHGTLFEFFRNDALDATDFFANRSGLKKGPFRFNQFGGTLGGPIIENKLFVFGSYQGTISRQKRTVITTVPTAQMKQGIFPFPVYDPLTFSTTTFTRQPFANNTIPQQRWDSVGAKLAALYPDPNLPGLANNYAGQIGRNIDNHQIDTRTDYAIGSKNTIFGRYSYTNNYDLEGSLFAGPGYGGNVILADQPSENPKTSWSVAGGYNRVFSSSLANELRLGYNHVGTDSTAPGKTSLYSQFGIKGVPNSDKILGLPFFIVRGYSFLGDRLFAPIPFAGSTTHLADNVTWTQGAHSIRFGGEYRRQTLFNDSSLPGAVISRGLYIFAGLYTGPALGAGNSFADLLLGQTFVTQLGSASSPGDLRSYNYGFYINDVWKATPKLTLNLGLRYEFQSPWWEAQQRAANFDLNPGSPTYGTIVLAKAGSIRDRSFVNPDLNNFGPRVGLAYQLNDKTVVRTGFGIFYGGLGARAGAYGPGNPPFSVGGATNTAGIACLILSCAPLQAGLPANILSQTGTPTYGYFPADRPTQETYQWNLSVQRQLPGNIAVTAGYVGSGTIHITGQRNINQPPIGSTVRPFPAIGNITSDESYAHATYHSMQIKAERRFTNGFSLLSSWTWSHALDGLTSSEDFTLDVVPQDSYNLSLEKASASFDIRHRWVTSAIFDLPVGRKDGFLGGNAATRAISGGWQLGAILNVQTGLPFTPTTTAAAPLGSLLLRPNLLREPNLSGSQRTVDRWFDTSAFAQPAANTIGTAGRNILRAPGLTNLDFLLSRSFRITEGSRLDFRAEFFNALNKTHLGAPNAQLGAPAVGTITTLLAPPRQIQFGLKFVF